jgi:hypothetical protein
MKGEALVPLPTDANATNVTRNAKPSYYSVGIEGIKVFGDDVRLAGSARASARHAACPILDTSTPKSDGRCSSVGRLFNRRNRKMWSRAIDGMRLAGRYYFLTLTTTPTSPSLPVLWNGLRIWLKAYRPGICWLYCFTTEGKGMGVIHMVVRLLPRQKNIDVNVLRKYWKERTGASQLKIKRVPENRKDDLASYIANQKTKVGLACEMGYQSAVTRWRWSRGWIPKGYGKLKSKTWALLLNADPVDRVKASVDLLHKMHYQEVISSAIK